MLAAPWWVVLVVAVLAGTLGYAVGRRDGVARGRADGTLEGWREGRDEGHSRGMQQGLEAGRAEALSYFAVHEEALVRKVGVWPVRATRTGVRQQLWFRGMPTTFACERWSTAEIEVDEQAMKALVQVGIPVLAKGGR